MNDYNQFFLLLLAQTVIYKHLSLTLVRVLLLTNTGNISKFSLVINIKIKFDHFDWIVLDWNGFILIDVSSKMLVSTFLMIYQKVDDILSCRILIVIEFLYIQTYKHTHTHISKHFIPIIKINQKMQRIHQVNYGIG